MRIAVDVMGADHGSEVILAGVKLALDAYPHIHEIIVVGNETEIKSGLERLALRDTRLRIQHASEVLTMQDKPLEAIRKKKDSSMLRAIELVQDGKADAVISTGNTGALVAGSLKLRRLENVERPVLAARMPSRTGDFVLIDAGANPTCEPEYLMQFAVMGDIYAREILGKKKPRIGILSNGSEETKGTDLTREAHRLCSQLDFNYIGYVEGFDLFDDAVDVVVTDGFTGNIVLKTSEGLGYAMMSLLKSELTANPVNKMGAFIARGAFRNIKSRLDPEVYGGAILLGLNGNVIKAHGSAREKAIMNSIRVAGDAVQHHLNELIVKEINLASAKLVPATDLPAK
ncbi:MAG: phosphate acyltransferase PlsX [Verrucomicrobiota bacterium]